MLLRDRRARDEHQMFVAEGPRVVEAAFDHATAVETLYLVASDPVHDVLATKASATGLIVRTITADEAQRIADTKTPQPIFATIRTVAGTLDALTTANLSVVCTQVNDPGNAGTLMRSAAAAGATALGLGAGSVDAYNPKVVRASAGACFAIATVEGLHPVEMLEALGEQGVQRLGAVPRAGNPPEAFDLTQPTAFVLGHETRGLAADLPLDGKVTIPMGGTESLNVAMAGTVLLFEAARQRRSAS